MGFIAPSLPKFDHDEWRTKPHLERVKPMALDWVENGFGTPSAIYVLYLVKIVGLYTIGGLALIGATTHGLGGLGDLHLWWSAPIVLQKLVVWTLLYEILGLGCGSMPLTFRFLPPIGGFLYWLRPGTMRLAPWPARIPGTSGTRRTVVDVVLYAAVLAGCVWVLFSQATHTGGIAPARFAAVLVPLALVGLRDKAVFLASRPEIYGTLTFVFLFPISNMIFAMKLIIVAMWWGAATSKLNKHFPFVITVMISNSPLQRIKSIKRSLYKDYPVDIRPSWRAEAAANGGTVVEYLVPLVLLLSHGGTLTIVAVTIMLLFHLHITSTFPLGVPLEWNLFVMYCILFLFGHYSHVGASSLHSPLLVVCLVIAALLGPVLGNFKPELVSFLPAMRYYAGNWATSQWLFKKGCEQKLNDHIVGPMKTTKTQLTKLYDADTADLLLYKGLAFRALHSHGRALFGLSFRAVDDIEDYDVREGEFVAGMALGWNFGEGHLHDEQLLAAIQELCHFAPGELRVVMLESQPMMDPRQRYRIVDAATGLVEAGIVEVADMVSRQPWLDGAPFPVQLTTSAGLTHA